MRAALALAVGLVVVGGACSSFEDGDNAASLPDASTAIDASDAFADADAGPTVDPRLLLGHWKLDDKGTQARDSAGDSHGTLTGGSWGTGVVDGAFSTDGTGCVEIAYRTALAVSETFSVTAWVNLQLEQGIDPFIFTYGTGFSVKLNGRYPQLSITGGGFWNITADVPVGSFHHLAVTFDAGVPAIWVDGVLGTHREGTIPLNARPPAITSPVRIGCANGPGNNAIGLIDDVRLYGRVLSKEEIETLALKR